jgi:hypothetical protein
MLRTHCAAELSGVEHASNQSGGVTASPLEASLP